MVQDKNHNKDFFFFKYFTVSHTRSTMKVGTDSVVLGELLTQVVKNCTSILDIGTGCGVLALICAQKFSTAKITAIDVDKDSTDEASLNFLSSPWAERLDCYNLSFQRFIADNTDKYDLIISNPPFFESSLKPDMPSRVLARHNDTLPFNVLAIGVKWLLADKGRFVCILLVPEAKRLMSFAKVEGLVCNTIINVFAGREDALPKRLVMAFRHSPEKYKESDFFIRENGDYTKEYKGITSDLLCCQI